jgi:hypothetical protein
MAFVNTVDKYGDDKTAGMLIDGSLTEYFDDTVNRINSNTFNAHDGIAIVDTPYIAAIGNRAFYGTPALKTVILRSYSGLVVNEATQLFGGWNSAINSKNGYIYVPSALLADYQAATNWSAYASQFRILEDYTVDGTATGDFDMSKI